LVLELLQLGDPVLRDHVGARGRDLAELHERRAEIHRHEADALGERDPRALLLAALRLHLGDGELGGLLDLARVLARGGGEGPRLLAAEAEALRELAKAMADEHDVYLP